MSDETTNQPTKRAERIGKYEIVGHIATGGMGIIYKARDIELDRLVALKILPPDMARQTTTLERFKREARAAAQLRHENIVTTFDVGEVHGTHFIALEFIEGADLQDYINRKCRLDPEDARQIIIQATRALAHAHERKIVHRDIKPSNFLLMQKDKRLIVKLTDFGLAMRYENDAEFRITRDKTTVGTVDYMSPEQARDSRSADIRSDIYSLGCTAYHMLAGTAPFAKGTLPERIVQHMQAPPPDVRKLNKSVPEYLVAIINKMLAKKPDDRYQTPAELLHDLENPENFLAPDSRAPAPAKLERGKGKQKSDPTSVIAREEIDEVIEEPKQTKAARTKRMTALKAGDRADESEARASTDTFVEPSEPREKKGRGKKGTAPAPLLWIAMAGGAVAVLALIIVAVVAFGGRTPAPPPVAVIPVDPDKPPPPIDKPPPIIDKPPPVIDKPPPPIEKPPEKMTVVAPQLPIMDPPPEKADWAALKKEYHGPFVSFPSAPAEAPLLRVSRVAEPGPGSFRTLEEALAQAKMDGYTVIEIRDDGPLFIPRLPALGSRWVIIRGGEGYRPLLVWDLPKKGLDADTPPTFASLLRGRLILENLDFVMHAPPETPAIVFDLSSSDFYARGCTFSVAGKRGQGVALLHRSEDGKAAAKTQTWLQRCYARGHDLTLLQLQTASADVLIEESLIAGYQQPLVQIRGRDQDDIELRSVRSALVSGQTFLRWQALAGKGGSPSIKTWLLDAIVSRDDTTAPLGDMIHLADGANPAKMRWQATNSAYGGWKRLLDSSASAIAGNDLAAWRRLLDYTSGDRALAETWPSNPPSGLEEQSASAFLPRQEPIAFAALTSPGAIGCVIGWLPAAPAAWRERVFEQRGVPPIAAADFDPPRIDMVDDGLYHGETLDLNKFGFDFGAYLNAELKKKKPAPRVVIHLAGKGVYQSSPLQIKGVQQLILYVKFPNELLLEVSPLNIQKPAPFIDMTGGRLELIGLRVRLNPITIVPSIISLRDADLTATRCWLQGPLGKSSDTFESLISIGNARPAPTTLLLRDNVLLSGKTIVEMRDNVQLRARNNLFFSLGDGLVIDVNRPTRPLTHIIDHNTFAARQHTFVLRTGQDFEAAARMLMHADSNAFWSPFADAADQRALLRGPEPWLAHDRFNWQGRYNVYDVRWPRYLVSVPKQADKQTLRDWQQTWGAAGEQEAYQHDPGPASKLFAVEGVAPALIVGQLERLTLPAKVRGDPAQAPPGANLLLLGIQKKKG